MRKFIHFVVQPIGFIYMPLLMGAAVVLIAALLLSFLAIPTLVLIFVFDVGMWKSIIIPIVSMVILWGGGLWAFVSLDDNNVGWFRAAERKVTAWHAGLLVERPAHVNRRELQQNYEV